MQPTNPMNQTIDRESLFDSIMTSSSKSVGMTYIEWQDLIFGAWSAQERYQLGEDEITRLNCQRICEYFNEPVDYGLFNKHQIGEMPEAANDSFFSQSYDTAKNIFKSAKGELKKSNHTKGYYPVTAGGLTDVYPSKPVRHQHTDPLAFNYKSQHDKMKSKPKIRRENSTFNYTFNHAKEYIKCAVDIVYWAETYGALTHANDLIHPTLYDYQKNLLTTMSENRKTIAMMARRTGKTVTTGLLIAHSAIFNKRMDIGIIAHQAKTSIEGLLAAKQVIIEMPDFLQPGFPHVNKNEIGLDNGIRVMSFSGDPDSMRGFTLGIVFADECSYMANWQDVYATIEPIVSAAPENKLIIASTPYGRNHFYELWQGALNNENGFVGCKALWYNNPRNLYNKETLVFDDGIPWEKETRSSSKRFDSEYLCQFDSNDDPLLVPKHVLETQLQARERYLANLKLTPKLHGKIKNTTIYVPPADGRQYLITADTAQGRGRDYHAVSVFDVTAEPFIQVAVLHDNTTKPMKLANRIQKLSEYYDDAGVFVELADTGEMIATELHRLGCQLVKESLKGNYGFPVKTPTVKENACLLLQEMLSQKRILLLDKKTITELMNFVEVSTPSGRASFEARIGFHDDMAMSCVSFAYASQYGSATRGSRYDDANLHVHLNGVDDLGYIHPAYEEDFGFVGGYEDGAGYAGVGGSGGLSGARASQSMRERGWSQTYGSNGARH